MRSIHKRLTRIDHWWRWYCQNSSRRQHRVDKRVYAKQLRRLFKQADRAAIEEGSNP